MSRPAKITIQHLSGPNKGSDIIRVLLKLSEQLDYIIKLLEKR